MRLGGFILVGHGLWQCEGPPTSRQLTRTFVRFSQDPPSLLRTRQRNIQLLASSRMQSPPLWAPRTLAPTERQAWTQALATAVRPPPAPRCLACEEARPLFLARCLRVVFNDELIVAKEVYEDSELTKNVVSLLRVTAPSFYPFWEHR